MKKRNFAEEMSVVYKDKKILCVMDKKRAQLRIEFVINESINEPGEDWFIDVNRVKKNNDVITSQSVIIKKDMNNWIEYFINQHKREITDGGKV